MKIFKDCDLILALIIMGIGLIILLIVTIMLEVVRIVLG